MLWVIVLLSGIFLFVNRCAPKDWTENRFPIARFSADPVRGDIPLEVIFDASASNDPDGIITLYDWDFGDGATGTGEVVSHIFYKEGQYSVILTVTDNGGAEAHISKTIAVDLPDALKLLRSVKFWAYQIQQIDWPGAVDDLIGSKYDMLAVEPTRTDWSEGPNSFDTKGMVAGIKDSKAHNNFHRKLVFAYIDIGEAEDWRWYWTWSKDWRPGEPFPGDWPDFIVAPDPDGWEGNYPVAYWDKGWKDIVLYGEHTPGHDRRDYVSILDEVIKDGFDGVYLDWVEAYDDESVRRAARRAGVNPEEEMIRFISEIRDYGRESNPHFLVIQQNAADLSDGRPELFDYVDAIAQEHLWYRGIATDDWDDVDGCDIPTPADWTVDYLLHLSRYQNAGLPVFCCEYALKYASRAYQKAAGHGFIGYCTRVSLSRLTTTPPPGY